MPFWILAIGIGAALGLLSCDSDDQGVNDAGSDGDGKADRTGINDAYVSLPFCSGRNIFNIQGNRGVGFCGQNPSLLYSFPITDDLSSVEADVLLELPQNMEGRAIVPRNIRFAGDSKVILSLETPQANPSAAFLMIDISAEAFVAQQVSATGLQIGRNPIGDPLPISGVGDIVFAQGEFWGVLRNINSDGSYRFGFGLALPQTKEGLVDVGLPPNENGVYELILSNRIEELKEENNEGMHFSFRTTDKNPTAITDLGDGPITIQDSGSSDSQASIDIAGQETHQLLEDRNVSLGSLELMELPTLAVDLGAMKVYPATATSLWEVDLSESAPQKQRDEIPLADKMAGQIASVVIRSGQALVGDFDGQILFVETAPSMRGDVSRVIDAGSGLSHMAIDENGNLFVAVGTTIAKNTPHIIAIRP